MTTSEFDAKCRELCPHCKAGAVLRQREDTREWVHDFATGDGGPLGRRMMGHSICHAHDFRIQNKDQLSDK
jgi:hypothetical protein